MIMPPDVSDRIKERYRERYEKFGHSRESLGWSKDKQNIRFYALTNQFDLKNADLLDIGCGFGDINLYFSRIGVKLRRYHGIDLVPEFIEKAKEIHAPSGGGVTYRLKQAIS